MSQLNDSHLSDPQAMEERKRAMYEAMSPRRRKFVDRLGYDRWDPFQAPFDPIDIRLDATGHTAQQLTELFMETLGDNPSPEYKKQISTFNVELVMNFERVRPLFEYCLWYAGLLESRGLPVPGKTNNK